MGDGFAGVDLLYLNIDNSSARSGTLPDDWGNLQSGDVVSTRVEGNEFRLRSGDHQPIRWRQLRV